MPDEERDQEARWMDRCRDLARRAMENGNVPVGSLIVEADVLVAEAGEELPRGLDVSGHAELIAIREACRVKQSRDLSGCTLYTTTEPCWMCAFAIRETGIRRVVFGAPTAGIGAVTSKYPLLTDPEISDWGPPPVVERAP